jgi:hypothetical protein
MLMARRLASTSDPTGPVIPAWNRGFCRNIADSNVDPERGKPEMKWIEACMVLSSPHPPHRPS